MFRLLALFVLVLTAGFAQVKLYLTDGYHHLVREYQVLEDRVRFYSVERSQWEEIPLSLVDLNRTEQEIRERKEALTEEAKALAAEARAERQLRAEAASVPRQAGVYELLGGKELRPLKQAEVKVQTSKRRTILQVLAPAPIVAGKATVELDGERAAYTVATDRPEFYVRLTQDQRFGILRLTPKKDLRQVEEWSIVPVTNEIFEMHEQVEVFRQQMGERLYKIWPMEPLKPGEYAVVEFTEGKGNIQVWDFAYRTTGGT